MACVWAELSPVLCDSEASGMQLSLVTGAGPCFPGLQMRTYVEVIRGPDEGTWWPVDRTSEG